MRDNQQRRKQAKRAPKPLNSAQLRELALNYVARFATSSGKLQQYLQRKVRERGWVEDEAQPDLAALVRDFAEREYLDDAAYAKARSADLLRRGYGGRRVGEALRHAGISEPIREDVAPGQAQARHAALHLLQKRRFGPFGAEAPDRERQQKQLAAMLRAGHSFDIARNLVEAETQDQACEWAQEYDAEYDAEYDEDEGFDDPLT